MNGANFGPSVALGADCARRFATAITKRFKRVNAAPNHDTGRPVPLVVGETYRVIGIMEFACPCGRSDALLDVGVPAQPRPASARRLLDLLVAVSAEIRELLDAGGAGTHPGEIDNPDVFKGGGGFYPGHVLLRFRWLFQMARNQ